MSFKEQGKNYNYVLENRCIYCGKYPKEGEQFVLDHDEDKVCPDHEKGPSIKIIINKLRS